MILPLFLGAAVFVATNTMSYAQNEQQPTMTSSKAQEELRIAMRKLWEDHITYTRNYIISALADFGDTTAVSERFLKNQDDISKAITPYYGEEGGKKLASLLRNHILIATEVVKRLLKRMINMGLMKQRKSGVPMESKLLFFSVPRTPIGIKRPLPWHYKSI